MTLQLTRLFLSSLSKSTLLTETAIQIGCRNFSISTTNKMRFVQFQLKSGGPQHLGAQLSIDGDIFDISAVDSSVPNSLLKCLNSGTGIIEKAKRYVKCLNK